ncbi:MAG: helix-turn-helix domain-containing protein [Luteitalea sp.]|nr:helix-turn-helix domain-containing protein [Luteitalea sp.]
MTSVPGSGFLPPEERVLFAEQFKKDLEFFQLLLLLINKSCPIRNVDLLWEDEAPQGRVGLWNGMGVTQALKNPCASLLSCSDKNPNPAFCNIVNDQGRRLAESCTKSDRAAAQLAHRTGKAQVYRCHAGLVDIAVPVICDGKNIATLYSGQVLRTPPSASGFAQIRKDVAPLEYVNLHALKKAYWQVPVVTDEDIQNTVHILEVFADYLAVSWKRLSEAVREQQRKVRELQLDRKEFAHLMLSGDEAETATLKELIQKIGFRRCPNRVLVVKLDTDAEYSSASGSFDLVFTKALNAIEELCEKLENVAPAYLRRSGVCIFLRDRDGHPASSAGLRAYAVARKVVQVVAERCDIRVRVGIGAVKEDWRELVNSYHEACMALAGPAQTIACYQKPAATLEQLSTAAEAICRHLSERNVREARLTLMSLFPLVNRNLGTGVEHLEAQRQCFTTILEAMYFTLLRLGCPNSAISCLRSEASAELEKAAGIFELQESVLQVSDYLLDEVRQLYAGKHEKIIERSCRLIAHTLEHGSADQPLTLEFVATAVGISPGHLSRIFKKAMLMPFERYVMVQRVELAKRLLLEPMNNISQVAEKCSFCNPAYFARVFRKIVGCSPSEYCQNPLDYSTRPRKQTVSSKPITIESSPSGHDAGSVGTACGPN